MKLRLGSGLAAEVDRHPSGEAPEPLALLCAPMSNARSDITLAKGVRHEETEPEFFYEIGVEFGDIAPPGHPKCDAAPDAQYDWNPYAVTYKHRDRSQAISANLPGIFRNSEHCRE